MKLIFRDIFWQQLSSIGNYKNKFLGSVVKRVKKQYKIYITTTKNGFLLPPNCSLCELDFDSIFKSIIADMENPNCDPVPTLCMAELYYPYFDIIK